MDERGKDCLCSRFLRSHPIARAAKLVFDLAGGSPAGGTYPVAIVAISGSEKSDRLAGSPEVKVSVG